MAYCGNCGKQILKDKRKCKKCNISSEKFQEPYNKITFELILIIVMMVSLLIIFISLYLLLFWSGSSCIPVGLILVILFYIEAMREVNNLVKGGYKGCKRCRKNTALNARYCIYCGKNIRWSLKQVSKRRKRHRKK